MKKFLTLARYKHTSHKEKTGGQTADGKKFSAERYQIIFAHDKEAQKTGDVRRFEIIGGDTRNTSCFYKKDSFHAVIADLPYGVQHASKEKNKPQSGGFTRNALGLLQDSLPAWARVLKPGGIIILAWNLFLISPGEMADLLADNGFTQIFRKADFSHRVDQAIERDVYAGILNK
jgi:tRNA G10  N-methylase Trm11